MYSTGMMMNVSFDMIIAQAGKVSNAGNVCIIVYSNKGTNLQFGLINF